PGMSFLLSTGPMLGLGEGGPQFDKKGTADAMINGQGGYRLATHGTRAPIQWLIGTSPSSAPHRPARDARALDVRLSTVASYARRSRKYSWRSPHVPRKEAPLRRAHLS